MVERNYYGLDRNYFMRIAIVNWVTATELGCIAIIGPIIAIVVHGVPIINQIDQDFRHNLAKVQVFFSLLWSNR